MFNLGLPEMILIAFVAILFFGRDKLSELARDTARSIKTFKQELKDVKKEVSLEEVSTSETEKNEK